MYVHKYIHIYTDILYIRYTRQLYNYIDIYIPLSVCKDIRGTEKESTSWKQMLLFCM